MKDYLKNELDKIKNFDDIVRIKVKGKDEATEWLVITKTEFKDIVAALNQELKPLEDLSGYYKIAGGLIHYYDKKKNLQCTKILI